VTTPNLAITHILQSQAQKEVTANAAFDALDNSANRALSLDLGDADLTLIADQANRNGLIIFTGALTAVRTVTLPANHRRLAVRNATSGGFPLTAKYPGGGASVAVAPDTTALLQGDGVDLLGVAGGGTGGGASALNDLTDVNATAAANGDLLRFDGSLWVPDAGGVHTRIPLPFKGALLQRSTDLTNISFPILIPFESTVYDTDTFWDAANPTRMTVPTGVTKVRLQGSVSPKPSATIGGVFVSFEKNGSGSAVGSGVFTVRQGTSGYTNNDLAANTAAIPVIAGDYFELRVNSTSSNWDDIQAGNRTWFAVEVVETADAANPPVDITGFKAGQPAADEVLLHLPIARRTRMKVDLAGSHAVAITAATAQTDFDIQRNGGSFATMRFGAGGTTASFIAASETVLDPGDVLGIVAPASIDATLADIGFAFAGALVTYPSSSVSSHWPIGWTCPWTISRPVINRRPLLLTRFASWVWLGSATISATAPASAMTSRLKGGSSVGFMPNGVALIRRSYAACGCSLSDTGTSCSAFNARSA